MTLDTHIEEAQKMYDEGHTFYAIAHQMKNWYNDVYSIADIQTALGGIPDNPIGHKKFRNKG